MTDNELLLAISQIMDIKLKPIEERLDMYEQEQQRINLIIENEIRSNIKLLAENYLSAVQRYEKASNEIDAMKSDIEILKKVVAEHSDKLQKIS